MSDNIDSIRAEAERLTRVADEAQAKLQRLAEREAAMTPIMRVAQLLHDEFSHCYDEDPWYYEIPSGADAETNWRAAWSGEEHRRFLSRANYVAFNVFGFNMINNQVEDEDMVVVEDRLKILAKVIGKGNTAGAARRRSEAYDVRSFERLRKDLDESIDKLLQAALKVMPHAVD